MDSGLLHIATFICLPLFFIVQAVLFVVLLAVLIWVFVKQIRLKHIRQQMQSQIQKSESKAFMKRFLFILFAIPLPLISMAMEGCIAMIYISYVIQSNASASVFFNLYTFGTCFCSIYLIFLLVYVSYLLASTVFQMNKSSIIGYRLQIAGLLFLMLLYTFFMLCTATTGGLSISASIYENSFTRQSRTSIGAVVLFSSTTSFWISYVICVYILAIGLRFYFVVATHSKKSSNQILIFLSILIISSLIQSLAVLILNFVYLESVATLFLLLYFFVQRISEIVFVCALLLLFIPVQQVITVSKQITIKMVQQAEKIADDIIGKKKVIVQSESSTSVTPSESIEQSTIQQTLYE